MNNSIAMICDTADEMAVIIEGCEENGWELNREHGDYVPGDVFPLLLIFIRADDFDEPP